MDRVELTRDQRWAIAGRLASDRLPAVNAVSAPVVPSRTLYARYVKRAVDVAVSAAALIVTAPINVIAAILTLRDVGHPVLFKQARVGRGGREFTLVKFRNMTDERDARGELLPPSERVTRFGKFMRRTSLDELLNFWSVLKGDMSLIGPRPLVPEYTGRYSDRHRMRLAVRPGLECPPRRPSDHPWTWQEQFENDVWYVEHVSFRTDCMMFKKLLQFALDKKNSSARAAATRGPFMGYSPDGRAIGLGEVEQSYIDCMITGGLAGSCDVNAPEIEEQH